jgi:alcohol dehydrogenase (cytochrome c)
MRLRKLATLAVLGVVAAGLAVASASASSTVSITAAPAFSTQLLSHAGADWPTTGGNVWNQHYSSLDQVNTSNVTNLKVAWTQTIHGTTGAEIEGAPLVYKGVMYLVTGEGDLAALDAATGAIIWKTLTNIPLANSFGINAQRGLALGAGKVFLAQNDGSLGAWDQKTGKQLWTRTINLGKYDNFLSPAAPTYYDGIVYIGMSGGDAGARGKMTAFDAETGQVRWQFFTIPAPGEPGSGSWPLGTTEWQAGGGAPWTWSVIDPDLGLVYFTTGNAGPYSGRGPGDNLFTSSVLALDYKTGQYRWHYQAIHHDVWDYDCPAAPVLFDGKIKGVAKQGLVLTCKTGYAYILDRTSGKPLLPIPERRVPGGKNAVFQNASKTQPIPVGNAFAPQKANPKSWSGPAPDGKPYKIGGLFSAYGPDEFTAVAPGLIGGGDWPNMSYDPNRQSVFVCAQSSQASFKAAPAVDGKPSPAGFNAYQSGVPKPVPGAEQGSFSAINVATNKIAWRHKFTEGTCYSGSAATAGNIVMVGTTDGVFHIYNSGTGEELLSQKLKYPISAPPITYSVNGKQYIALYDGGQAALLGGAKTKKDLMYVWTLG